MKSENVQIRSVATNLSRRTSGVLLHISSLPGKYGIGDLGPEAHRWIDMLAAAKQQWWQMLPLNPCGEGNSPYRSYSAFAGNPLLISPEQMVKDGFLTRSDLREMILPGGKVDYARVTRNKMALLGIAYGRHQRSLGSPFEKFVAHHSGWLTDFAMFMALREAHAGKSWTDWPGKLMRRESKSIAEAKQEFSGEIRFHQFVQFIFFKQLQALRDRARRASVSLIGDLPIFVSPDSADVWANPHLFQLDRNMQPKAVAGVPPDAFSSTGQCWGNPLYNWAAMRKDGFAWWKTRLSSALAQADLVRVDHFRGFESYWKIPAGAKTAIKGRWEKAPGVELFEALLKDDPNLPLVAEDLGIITPQVEALRDRFGFPGMRVLQFGFSGDPGNPHAPHNVIPHCFAYTGTHDNDTTAGWYRTRSRSELRRLMEYAPDANWAKDPAGCLVRMLMASPANHAIAPMQDLLGLDSTARMNVPGKAARNWEWRVDSLSNCKEALNRFCKLGRLYDRTPVRPRVNRAKPK